MDARGDGWKMEEWGYYCNLAVWKRRHEVLEWGMI